jgi:hypothetical protein
MHVNVNLEVSDQVARIALSKHACGNAERAVELLLRDIVSGLDEPATAPKSTKAKKPAKRR